MDLYMRQRVFTLADKYDIMDENENPVFRVEGEFLSFGARLHLYGMDRRELYEVRQELFHFLPRYTIYAGQTAAASVKKNFTLFGHSLSVESDYGHFEIEGSVFGWDFEIQFNGGTAAVIDKVLLSWGDTYHLHIAEGWNDPAFLCALTAAVDNCVHLE